MPSNDEVVRSRADRSRTTWAIQAAREEQVADHAQRVMRYACVLAETLRLDARVIEEIRIASLLHDIGKRALPAEILNKPTKLTHDEWRVIRLHSTLGSALAKRLGHSAEVCALVRHHHEHWDGSGYPAGLQGKDSPTGARVIALADVFDALTTPRPYRVALTPDNALAVMRTEAGTVLDPHLFPIFEDRIQQLLAHTNRFVGCPPVH